MGSEASLEKPRAGSWGELAHYSCPLWLSRSPGTSSLSPWRQASYTSVDACPDSIDPTDMIDVSRQTAARQIRASPAPPWSGTSA